MNIEELKSVLRENGIVGAGGAGFPSYAKLDPRTEVLLLNCSECEPLLKLHRQLLKRHAYEIMKTLQMVADVVGAKRTVIGIKREYKKTILALKYYLDEFPMMSIKELDCVYPMGDEVVLIYEATGKVVRPGGLPIEAGVTVFNVETMYNIYRALTLKQPVTDKLVTVVGEVKEPMTVRVPVGCKLEEVVQMAGGVTTKNPVYLVGGPMMGTIKSGELPVTKTTNAILVLPEDHPLVQKRRRSSSIDLKRAASACCQCRTCTDLCPRNQLGHPIEPHKFMRAAANKDYHDTTVFIDTLFCSSCGVCELYACPQGLAPRSLIADYKSGLRKSGVKAPTDVEMKPVSEARQYRKVPQLRLEARLGLSVYEVPAPLKDEVAKCDQVVIQLSQHIGAPAKAVVKVGDIVETGDCIAEAAEGLSVAIHASIRGEVMRITPQEIAIKRIKKEEP